MNTRLKTYGISDICFGQVVFICKIGQDDAFMITIIYLQSSYRFVKLSNILYHEACFCHLLLSIDLNIQKYKQQNNAMIINLSDFNKQIKLIELYLRVLTPLIQHPVNIFVRPTKPESGCLFNDAQRGNGKAPCGKLNSPFPIECALENPWGSVAICLRRSALRVITLKTNMSRGTQPFFKGRLIFPFYLYIYKIFLLFLLQIGQIFLPRSEA